MTPLQEINRKEAKVIKGNEVPFFSALRRSAEVNECDSEYVGTMRRFDAVQAGAIWL